MDKISAFIKGNSKYSKLSGPLRAAQICDTARDLANDRFSVVSFKEGLLTVCVGSSAAVANLQFERAKIAAEINQKIGSDWVKDVRIKIG